MSQESKPDEKPEKPEGLPEESGGPEEKPERIFKISILNVVGALWIILALWIIVDKGIIAYFASIICIIVSIIAFISDYMLYKFVKGSTTKLIISIFASIPFILALVGWIMLSRMIH